MVHNYTLCDKLKIFRSLFRGREDLFAIRWEKGTISGYMPAYQFDPYFYWSIKSKEVILMIYRINSTCHSMMNKLRSI